MSYNVFPTFAGRGWGIKKRPITRTLIQQADSGAEYRTQRYQYPLYEFDIEIPYLTQADSDALIGFYNQQGGPFQPFWFSADNDNSVTNQSIGTTDGTTTQYQLTKSNGSYWNEPIAGVQGNPSIFRTDWQGRQLLYSTARTNYVRNSGNVGGTNWSSNGAPTYTQNYATAPDGTTRATLVTTTINGAGPFSNSVVTIPSGTKCAAGIFAKASGSPSSIFVTLEGGAFPTYVRATFDLVGGNASWVSGHTGLELKMVALSGGWYWCEIAGTATVSTTATADFFLPSAGSALLFGGMFEEATQLGSYIDTPSGSSATVTDYTLSPSGALAIANPMAGAVLTWTGQYYYLLRFKDDQIETTQTLSQIYEATTLTLRSVR